ncbi:YadA-like family protein [Haemophilus influenzae]|uniref:YadA-like family protein n=1 Tax=Haemophilus influenzae TaxID=727 RepID=UPI001C52EF8A
MLLGTPPAKVEGKKATAIGHGAQAVADRATAVGDSARASGAGSSAIGYNTLATKDSAVALGNQAKAEGNSSVAVGHGSEAKEYKSTALGSNSHALGERTIAIGSNARANHEGSVAVGEDAFVSGKYAEGHGYNTKIFGNYSLTLGNSTYIGKPQASAGDVGFPGKGRKTNIPEYEIMTPKSTEKYDRSMAIGLNAKSFGANNLALGQAAEAHGDYSMALGTVSTSKGFSSIAIGRESKTNERYATALGTFAAANAESSLALGKLTVADKTDAVALGSYSKTNVDAGVFGYDPLGKTSPDDLLVGNTPEETEKLKEAYENFSNEEKDVKTVKDAEDAMRVEVEKRNDLLVKWNKNEADLKEVTNKLNTETDNAKKAELTAKKAEFLQIRSQLQTGYAAQAPDYEAKKEALKNAQDQLQADRKLVGKKIGAWQSTAAAVSVGDADNGITRQITNVAAGREDTDAVNVAQLKALEKAQKEISGKINQNDQTMQQLDRNVQTNTQSIQSLNRNVQKIDKDLRAGIAGAMAIGGLYQASVAGTKTISASVGSFKGQNAVAVGYSRLSDKGAIGVKFNASLTSTGDAGVSAGIGYTW